MDKNIVLRIVYSAVFVGLGVGVVETKTSVLLFVLSTLFIFGVSSAFQHYVLEWGLPLLKQEKSRIVTLLVWMAISAIIGAWSLYLLSTFDYLQEESILVKDFAWKRSWYLVGVSMFVGGACARRTLTRKKII